MALLPIIIAAILSTASPERMFDQSWGRLARSGHYHGQWRFTLPDGTVRAGDWIVFERGEAIRLFDSQHPDQQLSLGTSEGVVLPRSTTRIRGGVLQIDTRAVAPSLAQEAMLFERTYQRSLARYFNAEVRREPDALVLVMPFHESTWLGEGRVVGHQRQYAQETIHAVVTFRITAPQKVAITARETHRYIEDCVTWAHAASSCSFQPPSCTRR